MLDRFLGVAGQVLLDLRGRGAGRHLRALVPGARTYLIAILPLL